MRGWAGYALAAGGITAVVLFGLWPWVDGPGRRGLLVAAGASLPLQLGLFALLLIQRRGSPGFLAAWVGGTFLRLGAVVAVGAVVWLRDDVDPVTALLGTAGLLMALMALELRAVAAGQSGSMNESDRT